jgi:HSP20 family protein
MPIVRYDPFRELFQVNDQLARLFGGATRREEELAVTAFPTVDIYEDAEGIYLSADLPGIDPKAVEVKVENHTLSISGERKLERSENKDKYHRIESWSGAFNRSFTLPNTFDVEKVKAEHKNGLLRVFLPRREETKPRQVKVKIET